MKDESSSLHEQLQVVVMVWRSVPVGTGTGGSSTVSTVSALKMSS